MSPRVLVWRSERDVETGRGQRPGGARGLARPDRVPAGRPLPREMALEPDGKTLLVSNFISRQLEAVGVAGLP